MTDTCKGVLVGFLCLGFIEASRILVCVPCPSRSHQVVFYPLIKELIKRGHEVVFITTDPMYAKGLAPTNLTEINTHDVSYKAWTEDILELGAIIQGDKRVLYPVMQLMVKFIGKSFVHQMQTPEVQDLIKKKIHFDLVIVEANSKSAHALSHVFKAPLILMSSLGAILDNYHVIGAPIYPKLLYPLFWHQKLYNLSIYDKLEVLWDTHNIEKMLENFNAQENHVVKMLFGPDTPSLEELSNNVQMLFLNVYPIWESNRPVPPGVLFIGGIHQKPRKDLPKDLKAYLDSSEKGVVYFSLGTNFYPSTMPLEKIKAIANGLARLKYNVLVKWDKEHLPDKGKNTKVSTWLPQSDLLRHPNIKAFVTQGGLQSFDEALNVGVPLVGIPLLGDQWFNVEKFVSLKIGVGITEDLTEELLVNAVNTVIDDPSYRHNMIQLRDKLRDQPQSALERAVWWTEHVIRHKGASHLRAPAANMTWAEYLDVELMAVLMLTALALLSAATFLLYLLVQYLRKFVESWSKIKVE